MYKSMSAEEYRALIGLPSDYKIEGMLCYGTWDTKKQIQHLKDSIESLGKSYSYGTLPFFLEKMVEFTIDGRKFWFDVSYGGALLSEYLHLACLFGSKKNILLGSCGGLSPTIPSSDLIVPTLSYGDESSTRMYDPQAKDHQHYSDESLSKNLVARLSSLYKVWEGKTITCQAMMAETLEDVQNWSKEGYLGVEMEAATVFAVSNHFKVPAAAVLLVADNLIHGETIGSESYNANKQQKEKIRVDQYRVALEELLT